MATLVLAGVGGAIGGTIGGGVLGVSSVVIGKAIGATVGSIIDQRLLGGGGAGAVEVGKRDSLRLMASNEGAPIPRAFGQLRLSGQVIWASRFQETVKRSGGGKGGPPKPQTKTYTYSISLAVAVCEGNVTRISKIWADGQPIDLDEVNWRLYPGDEVQLPDPLVAASLPEGCAPAYRGTAYVVFEDLDLTPFGNRVPQLSFEVVRKAAPGAEVATDPINLIEGVALTPGTGEYALATEPVEFKVRKGVSRIANVNNETGQTDAEAAVAALTELVPNNRAASLVVSWFGDDLRCGSCTLRPKVEQREQDADGRGWRVSGLGRSAAEVVSYVEGRPGFGGTPDDRSIIESIRLLQGAGQAVMFYPFILMDIRDGNGLTNPWTGDGEQPAVPWRGRITASLAPGVTGSPDQTPQVATEVAQFFGTAQVSDFAVSGETVSYIGSPEWSYRRFILHYAHLCATAGGVDSFCIGSEMRGLTQLRDGPDSFAAVEQMRILANDVRAILGPDVKIGYAADWTEYFGYQPADGSGDVYYHLDPLWADPAIDFVGIDNYMPLSDWRDDSDHADAEWGVIYNVDYLRANIEGGEGYDWFYASPEARDAQLRSPIEDGAYDDHWVFRIKDIRNWWSRPHWNRPGGVRDTTPTAWEPAMKPVWFTEVGCPAVDKGTNQPNVFADPLSSENAYPYYSDGGKDAFLQRRYLEAVLGYWGAAENNPISHVYDGPMIDMSRCFVWAWDMRPWPEFPRRLEVWSDGGNHARGHWVNGRAQLVELAEVVRELCARCGVDDLDTTALRGLIDGYLVGDTESARQSLQPLLLAYGIDCFEREGTLVFANRATRLPARVRLDEMALQAEGQPRFELTRAPDAETPDRVRVGFIDFDRDYQSGASEAQQPGAERLFADSLNLPLVLTKAEADAVSDRWLAELIASRDAIKFALPRSRQDVGLGEVIEVDLSSGPLLFRVERLEETDTRNIEAVRIEGQLYRRSPDLSGVSGRSYVPAGGQPFVEFMDLPLLTGNEADHAPHVAATLTPWPGGVAVYASAQADGFELNTLVEANATMGITVTDLERGLPGVWSGAEVIVRLSSGALESRETLDVLNGANAAAIRAGTGDWEIIQYRTADLVGLDTYRLTGLLRGQAGTEWLIPDVLPAGADFVLLDGAQTQLDVQQSAIGLERTYRAGPAAKPLTDRTYVEFSASAQAVGQRPYAPAHGRASRQADGSVAVAWIRRTRSGGDRWDLADVPLSETRERYLVQVTVEDVVVREAEVTAAAFVYGAAEQAVDGAVGGVNFLVSQISDTFGPGPQLRISFDA